MRPGKSVPSIERALRLRYKTTFPSAARRPPHPALRATLSPKVPPAGGGRLGRRQEARPDEELSTTYPGTAKALRYGTWGWGREGFCGAGAPHPAFGDPLPQRPPKGERGGE